MRRARVHLEKGEVVPLLYAALEIRLGIEARLHQYRDAAEQFTSMTRRGWQIAHLAKDLERVFKTGEKVVTFGVYDLATDQHRKTFMYTPVSKETRQLAERLGDYLHYTARTQPQNTAWVEGLRDVVAQAEKGLAFATAGTLLAPPLRKRSTGQVQLVTDATEGLTREQVLEDVGSIGETVKVKIAYHDELPPSER